MRINLSDGRTLSFDLSDVGDADRWDELESSQVQQGDIRGATLHGEAKSISVTHPSRFNQAVWSAEIAVGRDGKEIGERISVQCDNVRLDVLLYRTGMVRVDLRKTGVPRHLAQLRRRTNDEENEQWLTTSGEPPSQKTISAKI